MVFRLTVFAPLAILALGAVDITQRCKTSTFEPALDDNARIESVDVVSKGDECGEGEANLAYPVNPTNLPELCAVVVNVTSSSKSSFRFGVFLPTEWNSKMLTVGNGGFAGGINWLDMGPGAQYGFATVSTDTGHSSNATDLTWALGNAQTRIDWGWRALHGSITLSKKLTSAYYSSSASHSFFSGCSTGGRQGLKELQKFPDSFDGALIGAPAWNPTLMNSYITRVGMYNLPVNHPGHVDKEMLEVVGEEARRQCDALDGVEDGIISAPELCDVDLRPLSCGREGVGKSKCLTKAQMETVGRLYEDFRLPNGESIWPGYDPGSEAQWAAVIGSDSPSPFGVGFQRYFVYDDPKWSWESFTHKSFGDAVRRNPGDTRADKYDLSDFRSRGGKILMYHGTADGLIPTRSTNLYYDRVSDAMGGPHTDFFRYFPVPGMQHCWATDVDAPWYFAGAFQAAALGTDIWSVPGFKDADHDMLLALVEWVEEGKEVDKVVATTWRTVSESSTDVLRQRPLCPFPLKAVYDAEGNVDEAASWSCGEEGKAAGRTVFSGIAEGAVVVLLSLLYLV